MLKNKYWILLFILVTVSCDSNSVFDEYRSVSNSWNKNETISFNMTAPDTINNYNLFVNLRNNEAYKFSNLFLVVELNYPNGKTIKDTLEYRMAAPDGSFLGTGFSDVKENKLWYKGFDTPFSFSEIGDYKINIQHAMRKNGDVNGIVNLEGVIDIGFRVEHANTN